MLEEDYMYKKLRMKRRKQPAKKKNKVSPPREYDENLGSNYFTNCSKIVYSVFFYILIQRKKMENKKGIGKARKNTEKLKTYKKLCKRERET